MSFGGHPCKECGLLNQHMPNCHRGNFPHISTDDARFIRGFQSDKLATAAINKVCKQKEEIKALRKRLARALWAIRRVGMPRELTMTRAMLVRTEERRELKARRKK